MHDLTSTSAEEILTAARDNSRVSGLTHTFYKYPARLSPTFVRAVIETFTEPGDWILDPFVGGGTTLVEAKALARSCIGVDNNELAVFVSKIKTTYLTKREQTWIRKIGSQLITETSLSQQPERPTEWIKSGYLKNLNSESVWRIRKLMEIFIERICRIRNPRSQAFLRCVLLSTGQWALDNRKHTPSVNEFRQQFAANVEAMLEGMQELCSNEKKSVKESAIQTPIETHIIHSRAQDLDNTTQFSHFPTPKLVITSPPYPGVHVLYHRWQIHGRRETPAPFWIANCLDGRGLSHYTFGWRGEEKLPSYFSQLEESFKSIIQILDRDTTIVQVVAFSDPTWQLPKYLEVLDKVGLEEIHLPPKLGEKYERLWREVPNRKWYAMQNDDVASNRELILIHRVI